MCSRNQRFTELRYVMVSNLPRPESIVAPPQPAIQRSATCPLCHTIEGSLSDEALAAGGGWRCTLCGQRWDAPRLATVAAYAVWAREYETMSRQSSSPEAIASISLRHDDGRPAVSPVGRR
jgi:hypothetical protein